jgi:hypothetical protein
VFINCPFDEAFLALFNAIVFALFNCGLKPRCAKEVYDGGEVRIEKIACIIRDCRRGIHDISRTDLNVSGPPRSNMPLELGLFLGAQRFGTGRQPEKLCVVMDREPYWYQAFISDIAGQDIAPHGDNPEQAIKAVRDWLAESGAGITHPPGAAAIAGRYRRFVDDLQAMCAATERESGELTVTEFAYSLSCWLKRALKTNLNMIHSG